MALPAPAGLSSHAKVTDWLNLAARTPRPLCPVDVNSTSACSSSSRTEGCCGTSRCEKLGVASQKVGRSGRSSNKRSGGGLKLTSCLESSFCGRGVGRRLSESFEGPSTELRLVTCSQGSGETSRDAGNEDVAIDSEERGTPGMVGNRRALFGFMAASFLTAQMVEVKAAAAAEAARTGSKSWLLGDIEGSMSAFAEKRPESRVYDTSAIGQPMVLTEKERIWNKFLSSRVVYLGESESVPDPADKVLTLEIVSTLRDRCFQQKRAVSVALEIFPRPLQNALDLYLGKRVSDAELRAMVPHLPKGRFEEYLPLLHYCRDHGVRMVALGVPPEVLRQVKSGGVSTLSESERRRYAPALGSGPAVSALPGTGSGPSSSSLRLPTMGGGNSFVGGGFGFDTGAEVRASRLDGIGPYQFAQARAVVDYTAAQTVGEAMAAGGAVGMLIVVMGASHVMFGSKGRGVPSRVAGKLLLKQQQTVVLLNPERQRVREEGDPAEADFLWYAGAKACTQNCFSRAEVARVMSAAGRTREALPQDLQLGVEQGLVSPDTLRSFFELDRIPILAEATQRFQGLRERFLADPRFLQRLAAEEAIYVTTTLAAQYQKRGERFWSEIDFVAADTLRGMVVDFCAVWLPAPTLSFRSLEANQSSNLLGLANILGVQPWWQGLPQNAFQRAAAGQEWDLAQRGLAVVASSLKFFLVGFSASLGTGILSNAVINVRDRMTGRMQLSAQLAPGAEAKPARTQIPVAKTALVYGGFLGTSSNLRYQFISGVVEHWIADVFLASNPAAGTALSLSARILNSFFGTLQWVDISRRFGLSPPDPTPSPNPTDPGATALEAQTAPLTLPDVSGAVSGPMEPGHVTLDAEAVDGGAAMAAETIPVVHHGAGSPPSSMHERSGGGGMGGGLHSGGEVFGVAMLNDEFGPGTGGPGLVPVPIMIPVMDRERALTEMMAAGGAPAETAVRSPETPP